MVLHHECRWGVELGVVPGERARRSTHPAGGYPRVLNFQLGNDTTDLHRAPLDNPLGLILGGKGGSGTREACRAPERLAAIATLQSRFSGIAGFTHFYRLDDNSGTTDTIREKLQLQRFCNDPAPGSGDLNTGNRDLDPIRFGCPPADSTHRAVSCWSDGSVCPSAGGTCPIPPRRPAGWACSADAECTVNCDTFSGVCQ